LPTRPGCANHEHAAWPLDEALQEVQMRAIHLSALGVESARAPAP